MSRRHAGSRQIVLLCAWCALCAGEVRIDASCPWEDKDGYTPMQVRIDALIAPVEVLLDASYGTAHARDRVRVEPGRPINRTLLLPSHSGYGSFELRWSTPGDHDTINVPVTIDYRAIALAVLDPREQIPVPALLKLVESQVPDAGRNVRGGYRSSTGERVRRIAPDLLPDRWLRCPNHPPIQRQIHRLVRHAAQGLASRHSALPGP